MKKSLYLAVTLLAASPAFAARTLVVDKDGGDFTSVAEASREAKPGDTVFIRSHADVLSAPGMFAPGVTYASDGVAPESIALKGAVGVTFRGFRLKAFSLEGGSKVTLEKCRVEGGAVVIKKAEEVTVRDCAFVLPNAKTAPDRVVVEFSQKVALTGNFIRAARRGIVLLDAEATVTRNTIVGASYEGPKLDVNDLAEAHDALTSAMAVLVQCNPTMMEAWDKRKARPAEFGENIVAHNERGIVVDRCQKGNAALKTHHNVFHVNQDLHYVSVGKRYSGSSFSYALDDILAKKRMEDSGNAFVDPLFTDFDKSDFSLRSESPAARLGKDKGAVGASPEALALAVKEGKR